jgi:cobalt/nickel transport system ATP-binding protein
MSKSAISVEKLSFTYPDGRTVLKDISMNIDQGECVALIGPNGAGKSTLLLHLNGILQTDGIIRILGETITKKNLKWIREKVGLVFQNPDDQLFSPTVYDDIVFGLLNTGHSGDGIIDLVKQSLTQVGMSGYEDRSPHHLSLGEKKRIAIASVLCMKPEIIAFDEPTSNLDPRGRWALIKLITTLPSTKIIATHDLDMVRKICPRTIIISEGRLIADGKTSQILEDTVLLKASGLAPE